MAGGYPQGSRAISVSTLAGSERGMRTQPHGDVRKLNRNGMMFPQPVSPISEDLRRVAGRDFLPTSVNLRRARRGGTGGLERQVRRRRGERTVARSEAAR